MTQSRYATLALSGALIVPVLQGEPVPARSEVDALLDRPNVLFIAIDDLNDWVGCFGGHAQAAGCTLHGTLAAVKERVLPRLYQAWASQTSSKLS